MEGRKGPSTMGISGHCAAIRSFCSTTSGTGEGGLLLSGNVHSVDRCQEVLEPVVERYQRKGVHLLFRGDAAFAKP